MKSINLKSNSVFFFIPNLVGYIRICLYAISFIAHMVGCWQWCLVIYLLAFFLDELDGLAAKTFNQRSQFGATLDMVTDRVATAGLCMLLAQLYPNYLLVFILLIALDISSHYYLLQATALQSEHNHKNTEGWSKSRLLNLYYGNKRFMDMLIVGNEVFYLLLYFNYYAVSLHTVGQALLWLVFPLYLLKQIINIAQLQSSAVWIVDNDRQIREVSEQ